MCRRLCRSSCLHICERPQVTAKPQCQNFMVDTSRPIGSHYRGHYLCRTATHHHTNGSNDAVNSPLCVSQRGVSGPWPFYRVKTADIEVFNGEMSFLSIYHTCTNSYAECGICRIKPRGGSDMTSVFNYLCFPVKRLKLVTCR